MGFQDILMSADLLGFPPYFTFKGMKTYKSTFGALLSILAFIISIFSVYSSFESWLYQINASILKETFKNDQPLPLATINNKIVVMFSQVDLKEISKSTVLSYEDLGSLVPSIIYANVTSSQAIFDRNIKLSKCDPNYISDMDSDFSQKAFCLPPELSYKIFQKESTIKLPFITIDSSFHEFVSKDPSVMTLLLIWYQETVLSSNGTDKIYTREWNQKQFLISSDVILFYSMEFSEEQIFKNGQDIQQVYTVTSDRLLFNIQMAASGAIPMVSIKLDYGKYGYKTNIKFVQITDVLSAFGGMIGLVLGVFKTINQMVSNIFMQVSMINEMFKFHYFISAVEEKNSKIYHKQAKPNQSIISCINSFKYGSDFQIQRVSLDNEINEMVDQTKLAKIFKTEVKFTCKDLAIIRYTKRQDMRLQILRKANEIFNNSIQYGNILKNGISAYLLRSYLFEDEIIPFTLMPSLNQNCKESLNFLDRINSFQTVDHTNNCSIYRTLYKQIEMKPKPYSKLLEHLAFSII